MAGSSARSNEREWWEEGSVAGSTTAVACARSKISAEVARRGRPHVTPAEDQLEQHEPRDDQDDALQSPIRHGGIPGRSAWNGVTRQVSGPHEVFVISRGYANATRRRQAGSVPASS
jgi:hypothetical protein